MYKEKGWSKNSPHEGSCFPSHTQCCPTEAAERDAMASAVGSQVLQGDLTKHLILALTSCDPKSWSNKCYIKHVSI